MSTKGLMTHKKVEEVTLNAAGKADTLTLRAPWAYNGERGPFKLTNVEHGHTIVKGATSDGSAPTPARSAPQRSVATVATPGADPGEDGPKPERVLGPLKPHAPRGDEIIVYRLHIVPKEGKGTREFAGWLLASKVYEKDELATRTWETLGSLEACAKANRSDFIVKSFRWMNKNQAQSRKDGDMGSPWGSQNHG